MTPGEKRTILAVLRDLRANGYAPVAVWDGEEYNIAAPGVPAGIAQLPEGEIPDELHHDLTDDMAIGFIDSVDMATLHFTHQNKRTWGNRGCMFIMGNDPEGSEVLADHHCPEGEDFSRLLDAITDRLIDGVAP